MIHGHRQRMPCKIARNKVDAPAAKALYSTTAGHILQMTVPRPKVHESTPYAGLCVSWAKGIEGRTAGRRAERVRVREFMERKEVVEACGLSKFWVDIVAVVGPSV